MRSKLPFEAVLKLAREEQKLVLDPRVWPKCTSKEVEEWSWKQLKNLKFVVHNCGDTIEILEVTEEKKTPSRRRKR